MDFFLIITQHLLFKIDATFLKDHRFFISEISIYIIEFYFWVLSQGDFLNNYITLLKK